ncbi:RNA-binding protein [Patescibacteria group bacterium]|nr:RNA-binding protein [Patescibacteria group bacterium]MBU1703603.1 RNA-binding protein [Patescibacteria group bacterium]MBU1953566.1 RNA-binding protein [Patescibacteria group bacterium]
MANKLFVGNIDWSATDDDLRAAFASFGDIEEVAIVKDKFSGRSKGFGFVTFASEEDAQKAIAEMDGYDLKGRKIAVSEARPPKPRD